MSTFELLFHPLRSAISDTSPLLITGVNAVLPKVCFLTQKWSKKCQNVVFYVQNEHFFRQKVLILDTFRPHGKTVKKTSFLVGKFQILSVFRGIKQ